MISIEISAFKRSTLFLWSWTFNILNLKNWNNFQNNYKIIETLIGIIGIKKSELKNKKYLISDYVKIDIFLLQR